MSALPAPEIRRDLACPACQYNLRGLRGSIVTCPECGAACDVVDLVTKRWDDPWYRAPGYNRVMMPAAWTLLSAVTLLVLWPTASSPGGHVVSLLSAALLLAAVQAALVAGVWRLFNGAIGVVFVLLAHVLLAGYLVGVFGLLASLMGALVGLFEGAWAQALVFTVTSCSAAVIVAACQQGEMMIARACIRQHFSKKPLG
jgi:hypothetical protein